MSIINRAINTPSPVVFPSASPTPKLFSTPSKKLPDAQPWQEFGIESVPQNSANIANHQEEYNYNQYQHYYHSREKSSHATRTVSPLSLMESDILLDDENISSYQFSEDDLLSSIISSRSSVVASPLRRRALSLSSPSPLHHHRLYEKEEEEESSYGTQAPIVGKPLEHIPTIDPIAERRYSQSSSIEPSSFTQMDVRNSNTRFGSFLSKVKKAASGKPSLFK